MWSSVALVLCSLLGAQVDAPCAALVLSTWTSWADGEGRTVFYYGDQGGRVHRLEARPEGLRETAQVGLNAGVKALVAADLDGDGTIEVAVATTDGRLSVLHGETLGLTWRTHEERYGKIEALAVANVDQDPPLEVVLLADDRMVIYDGLTRFKEWTSPQTIRATDMAVGDVDGDGEVELVLSSGVIMSTVFFHTEWDVGEPFGQEVFLVDLDGDGRPEIVGKGVDGTIRVFSGRERRELW